MPSVHDTRYQARFQLPDLLEREAGNTLQCPVWLDGALAAPTAEGSSVTLVDASGAAVSGLDAAEVTVTGSIATATYTPPATLALGQRYQIRWRLVYPGQVFVFRNEAAIVRHRLYSPVTDEDLFRVVPDLRPSAVRGTGTGVAFTSYQTFLDEALVQLEHRLWKAGRRPELATSPSDFRSYLLYTTLAMVFEALAGGPSNGAFLEMADRYRRMAADEWARLDFVYDADDDGIGDQHRRAPMQALWTAPPPTRRGW